MKRNFIDKAISWVSPSLGLSRARARLALEVIERHKARSFDAAGSGRRFDGWKAPSTSAAGASFGVLDRLRARSRDLTRNDENATKAVSIISSNVVGTGIIPQARSSNKKRAALAQDLWNGWGESIACDFDENHDAYGLQALVMREIAEAGEVLIRRVIGKNAHSPIPLQLQVLEADFIDSFKTSLTPLENGGFIFQGVEFDKRGKKVAYWLYDRHPGDVAFAGSLQSTRVPAEDIIHLFRIDRAGQVRGIPWSAPVLLKMRDLNDFEDAHLIRQKIAACFTAFIEDAEIPADPVSGSANDPLTERVEPGMIQRLPPGKKITFGSPPGLDGFADVNFASLSAIARGFGVSYEALTGDFSRVNFASGRLSYIEFQKSIDQWRWHMMIPRGTNRIWSWFIEAALVAGYEVTGVTATHTPPKRVMVNPLQEISAQRAEVRMGAKSLFEVIRENGDDPEKVLEEIHEANAVCDRLGLILDSDPRKITNAGQIQADQAQDPANAGGDGGKQE